MIGTKFGNLTVVEFAGRRKSYKYWVCRCDCGVVREIRETSLKDGSSKSCGCVRVMAAKKATTKHGQYRTRLYKVWNSMVSRCHCESHGSYKSYGAKGINVCAEWRNSFVTFLEDMGEPPTPKHQLDRIDNTTGYSKSNCRWVTHKENQNNKSTNRLITIDGITKNLQQWCEFYAVNCKTVESRLRNGGWQIADALASPVVTIENRGDLRLFTYRGETKYLSAWCRDFGRDYNTVRGRIRRGWSFDDAITKPAWGKTRGAK